MSQGTILGTIGGIGAVFLYFLFMKMLDGYFK